MIIWVLTDFDHVAKFGRSIIGVSQQFLLCFVGLVGSNQSIVSQYLLENIKSIN